MSEATVVEAIVVEAMADSREAGEETTDGAMGIEEVIAGATVGVVESAAVHANEITGHPAEALLRIGQAAKQEPIDRALLLTAPGAKGDRKPPGTFELGS